MNEERIADVLLIIGAAAVAVGVMMLAGPAWALIVFGCECLIGGLVLARSAANTVD